jgi:methyl-accepting chemotaxis protein
MVLGVAVGIAVADLLGRAVGSGAWQLAFVSALAMLSALVLFQSPLFISQAGIWALLVVTVPQQGDLASERLVDALVGGAVALLFAQVIFPLDPLRLVRGAAQPVFDELAGVLNEAADALERRDLELAEEIADRAAAIDSRMDSLEEAFGVGKSAARVTRTGRRARPGLEPYAAAVEGLALAVGNVRVLAGAIARRLRDHAPSPPDLVEAIRELARAVTELAAEVEEHRGGHRSRGPAVAAARRAGAVAEEAHDLATLVIVHQVESTAYDLLRGGGVEADRAQEALSA